MSDTDKQAIRAMKRRKQATSRAAVNPRPGTETAGQAENGLDRPQNNRQTVKRQPGDGARQKNRAHGTDLQNNVTFV